MNLTNTWLVGALSSVTLILTATATVSAQDERSRFRSREGRGSFERGESERGNFERGDSERGSSDRGTDGGGERRWGDRPSPSDFLKRMDENGNGILEPNEVSGRTRFFVERAARDAGMDPAQPLPVAKLQEAMNQSRERMQRGESSRSDSGRSDPNGSSDRGSSTEKNGEKSASSTAKKSAEKAAPLVPGFGQAVELAMAPGFDVPLASTTVVAPTKTTGGESDRRRDRDKDRDQEREREKEREREREKEKSRSAGESNPEDKTRRYAEAMLKQYDVNKNGVLEKDEWSKMPGEPAKADKNGDGQVTLDELSTRLTERAKEGFGGGPPGGGPQGGSGNRSYGGSTSGGWGARGPASGSRPATNSSTGKAIRFLTAQERLPEGMPAWFLQNDKDSDGQVSMAEYASAWNDAKLAEYLKYDLNNDGWITPAECVAVEKKK